MFASFKVPPAARTGKNELPTTQNSLGLVDARGYTLIACNTCRARKVSSNTILTQRLTRSGEYI